MNFQNLPTTETQPISKSDYNQQKLDIKAWLRRYSWWVLLLGFPLYLMYTFTDVVDGTNTYLNAAGIHLYLIPNGYLFVCLVVFVVSFMVDIKGLPTLSEYAAYPTLLCLAVTAVFNGLLLWKIINIFSQCADVNYVATTIMPTWSIFANHTALCSRESGGLFGWSILYFIFVLIDLAAIILISIFVWLLSRSVATWGKLILSFKSLKAQIKQRTDKIPVLKQISRAVGLGDAYLDNPNQTISTIACEYGYKKKFHHTV